MPLCWSMSIALRDGCAPRITYSLAFIETPPTSDTDQSVCTLTRSMATPSRTRRRIDRRTRAARAEGRAERGYRDASVDEIAARAGYSKGAIYFHFSGKEDLFFALLEERVDAPLHAASELLATAPPQHD